MFYCIVLTIIFHLTIVNRIVVDGNKATVSHMADQKQMLTLFVSFRTTSYCHIIINVDIISWHILTWIFNTQFIIPTSRMVGNIQYLLYINHWWNVRDDPFFNDTTFWYTMDYVLPIFSVEACSKHDKSSMKSIERAI